ncbi:MAG TPA: LLM class flavin-dependent oxidoreductase [Actinomycetota bacterium]|nr:LLM class flavin-dependent oxidoreductase [Actinomycetota bacterium]
MRVGIGLPSAIPGTPGERIVEWARRADEGPFSSVGVLDRIAYDSFDPLISLTAAAAVTSRIKLVTMVVIGPLRTVAVLAKEAASLDAISGGRFVLGLGIGARADDYTVSGLETRERGQRLADQLLALKTYWEDDRVGPHAGPSGGPLLLAGGQSGEAFARMAGYADGYVHGGGPPRAFASAASRARAAWSELGRPGQPALWGQGYFALGPDAEAPGAEYLRHYYAFTGPFAEKVAAANLTTPQAVIDLVRGYEEAGCDELVLLPTVPDPSQVARLADVIG